MRKGDFGNKERSTSEYTVCNDAQTIPTQRIRLWVQNKEGGTHKSAPKTAVMAAGKPKAQYGELLFIRANNNGATDVNMQPMTVKGSGK